MWQRMEIPGLLGVMEFKRHQMAYEFRSIGF